MITPRARAQSPPTRRSVARVAGSVLSRIPTPVKTWLALAALHQGSEIGTRYIRPQLTNPLFEAHQSQYASHPLTDASPVVAPPTVHFSYPDELKELEREFEAVLEEIKNKYPQAVDRHVFDEQYGKGRDYLLGKDGSQYAKIQVPAGQLTLLQRAASLGNQIRHLAFQSLLATTAGGIATGSMRGALAGLGTTLAFSVPETLTSVYSGLATVNQQMTTSTECLATWFQQQEFNHDCIIAFPDKAMMTKALTTLYFTNGLDVSELRKRNSLTLQEATRIVRSKVGAEVADAMVALAHNFVRHRLDQAGLKKITALLKASDTHLTRHASDGKRYVSLRGAQGADTPIDMLATLLPLVSRLVYFEEIFSDAMYYLNVFEHMGSITPDDDVFTMMMKMVRDRSQLALRSDDLGAFWKVLLEIISFFLNGIVWASELANPIPYVSAMRKAYFTYLKLALAFWAAAFVADFLLAYVKYDSTKKGIIIAAQMNQKSLDVQIASELNILTPLAREINEIAKEYKKGGPDKNYSRFSRPLRRYDETKTRLTILQTEREAASDVERSAQENSGKVRMVLGWATSMGMAHPFALVITSIHALYASLYKVHKDNFSDEKMFGGNSKIVQEARYHDSETPEIIDQMVTEWKKDVHAWEAVFQSVQDSMTGPGNKWIDTSGDGFKRLEQVSNHIAIILSKLDTLSLRTNAEAVKLATKVFNEANEVLTERLKIQTLAKRSSKASRDTL